MIYGVDYYPEHWPAALLEEDLKRIVDLGATAIRIGEFAWHLIESKEGVFDFSFFDHVIQRARAHGLKVVYGTPTATFPAWLAKKDPQILSVDAAGNRRAFGGRRQYCYNSKTYLEMSLKMVRKLVAHYASSDVIFMWQVDNEFGHEGSDECFCDQCHQDFQLFLADKYVTIDHLNDVYGTIFWGQTYNNFDEIPMPTMTITTHNPVLKLDWYKFRSASLNQFAQAQIACIKDHKGAHQEVTHNFFGGYFDRQYDQNVMSEWLDVVSYDNYPVWGGLKAPLSPAEVAMGLDYMRGLKQKNFWVMEQLIGAQGHDDIGYLPREGESTLWAAQAMARGCESLFYFRYRGAVKGQEQFCQGILDADNRINDKYREVQRFFKWAKTWQPYFSAPVQAPVALVYDYANRSAWRGQRQSDAFNYTQEVLRFYRPFHASNIPVDVIDMKKNWSDYPVVVMPLMQLMSEDLAKSLEAYVQKGGILIAGYRHGIKDLTTNLIFGQKAPCYGQTLFGVEVETYEALGEGIAVGVYKDDEHVGLAKVWRDLLTPLEAQILYTYEPPYGHFAAVTKNSFGKGHAYYIGTGLEDGLMAAVVSDVVLLSGLEALSSPEGLEIMPRVSGGNLLYFVMNHLHKPVTFKGIHLEALSVKVLNAGFKEVSYESS